MEQAPAPEAQIPTEAASLDAAHEPETPALPSAEELAHEQLAREFPEALKPGSELYEACQEEFAYLKEAHSPLCDDPQARYKIARRMSRLLTPRIAPVPTRPLRPVPTGGAAPAETPLTTLERRVSNAKSSGEMLSLMREIGTPFEALLQRR